MPSCKISRNPDYRVAFLINLLSLANKPKPTRLYILPTVNQEKKQSKFVIIRGSFSLESCVLSPVSKSCLLGYISPSNLWNLWLISLCAFSQPKKNGVNLCESVSKKTVEILSKSPLCSQRLPPRKRGASSAVNFLRNTQFICAANKLLPSFPCPARLLSPASLCSIV